MTHLSTCPACDGFVPQDMAVCPHCSTSVEIDLGSSSSMPSARSPLQRLVRGALMLTSGSAFAMTLMACYGGPPCEEADDADGDGHYDAAACFEGTDCDDDNPDVHPLADDPEGDDIDQNCDGVDGIAEEDDGGVNVEPRDNPDGGQIQSGADGGM